MEEEKKNNLCSALLTYAPQLIEDSALLRHVDDEDWALSLVERDLKNIVALAAEFGITTENALEWKNKIIWPESNEDKDNG